MEKLGFPFSNSGRSLVSALTLLLLLVCSFLPMEQVRPMPNTPPPTEHWLDEGAETRQMSARKEYYENMHRAAPGVDWRAVERENGLAAMDRRRETPLFPPLAPTQGTWRELGSRNLAGRTHTDHCQILRKTGPCAACSDRQPCNP